MSVNNSRVAGSSASHVKIHKPIQGPGLKKQGIVILQFLILALLETFEYQVTRIGMITGVAMVLLVIAGLYLGRPGTQWVNAVTIPIAFGIISLIEVIFIGHAGVHISKLATGLVAILSAGAPYLLASSLIAWIGYFVKSRSAK